MFCITSEAEGEDVRLKLVSTPGNLLMTVPRWQFCCGPLLPGFGVKVSVTFHLTFVHIIFISVWVAECHLLGKNGSLG